MPARVHDQHKLASDPAGPAPWVLLYQFSQPRRYSMQPAHVLRSIVPDTYRLAIGTRSPKQGHKNGRWLVRTSTSTWRPEVVPSAQPCGPRSRCLFACALRWVCSGLHRGPNMHWANCAQSACACVQRHICMVTHPRGSWLFGSRARRSEGGIVASGKRHSCLSIRVAALCVLAVCVVLSLSRVGRIQAYLY